MKPSVGCIVHFYQQTKGVREADGPFAAIVTRVYDEEDQPVNLTVFIDGITQFEAVVSIKEFNDRRYWAWPSRDAAPAPAVIDPKALPAPAMPEAVILSGYVPAIEGIDFDPSRRNDPNRQHRAERAIIGAGEDVGSIGAHPWLVDAIILLAKARDKVADYIDLIAPIQRELNAASEPRVDDTGEDIDPSLRA